MQHSHTSRLIHAVASAAKNIELRDIAKARLIHQLHSVKELTFTRNPNKRLIEKEFDELHARIVDLVRHEKGLIKLQEEDAQHFGQLREHIAHIEERLKKSEEIVSHSLHNTKKIDEIDKALSSLYKKLLDTFDIKDEAISSASKKSEQKTQVAIQAQNINHPIEKISKEAMDFILFGSEEKVDVNLDYSILDKDNGTVLSEQETFAVETKVAFTPNVFTSFGLPAYMPFGITV